MLKSKFKSILSSPVLTVKQLFVITFVFNLLIYRVFYNDWLSGKINLLGAPDTVIPFYSSFYMTNSIANFSLSSWNFYNQTDFAYAHMSTGWWSTSGLVTALVAIIVNIFFEINGQSFIQIHLLILVICQTFLRLIGMILLMKAYNLKNSTILITTCLVSPIIFGRFSFSYHVSIVYSSIFLFIYLLDSIRQNLNFRSISKFIMFATAIVFQEPLFAISYLGQILFCYAVFQLIIYAKENKIIVNKIPQYINSRSFKPKFGSFVGPVSNCIYVLLTIFLFYIWSKSISTNYFFTENRAQSPFINLQTMKILVGTQWSEDLSKILTMSSTAMVSGWPFMGITFVFFSFLGLIGRFDRKLIPLKFLALVFILMQFSINKNDFNNTWTLFDLPIMILKILGAILRFLLYLTFPFSFLFRSGGMLVWLIASILIIFFAIGLDKYVYRFSQRSINKKYLSQILITLVFILFLSRSLHILLTLCIGILVSIFLYFVPRSSSVFQNVSRFAIPVVASLFLLFDLISSSVNAEVSKYTGTKLVPNSFVFERYSTPFFIPQYVTPFSKLSFRVVSPGSSPDVLPISKAILLSVYRDGNYFGPNELNSYFYQTTYMGNYKSNTYYQNKNILFANYLDPTQTEYLPTVVQDSSVKRFGPVTKPTINRIELGTIHKVISNPDGSKLYVFNCRYNASELRSSFDPKVNTVFFEIDGKKLYPVKGKPISINSFDFGNYYSGKLTFVSKIEPPSINSANLQLFSVNDATNRENAFLKSEIYAGGLKIDNSTHNSRSVTFAIPFQAGWRIYPTDKVYLRNSNGWLKAENLEPKTYNLEFNPYFPLPYYSPFFILLWASVIFFSTPFNLLKPKVSK